MEYLLSQKRSPEKLGLIFKLMIEVLSISDGLHIDRLDSFFNSYNNGFDSDVIKKLREIRYISNGFTILCLVLIMNI